MAYSVDWITKIITIPTSDLIFVSGARYQLDMFEFLNECRRLEWGFSDGLWAPTILDHTNAKVDFAGADYAGFDEITNGYTIQFSGAAQRVDLIASNNNLIDTLIITGVSVVPSNSAGLITNESTVGKMSAAVWNTAAAEHLDAHTMGRLVGGLDYEGAIWVDLVNGSPGVVVNENGTRSNPVDNLGDAVALAGALGYSKMFGVGNYIADRPFTKATLIGNGSPASFDLNGYDFTGTQFEGVDVTGDGGGSTGCSFYRCRVTDLTNISGQFIECMFSGETELIPSGSSPTRNFLDGCTSYVPGLDRPSIGLSNSVADIQIRNWHGGIFVRNVNSPLSDVSIDLSSGSVTLTSSVTAGIFRVGGVGVMTDNSSGTTVDKSGLVNQADIASATWAASDAGNVSPGSKGEALALVLSQQLDLLYDGYIWVDTTLGTPGTVLGTHGTKRKPCTSIVDATVLALAYGTKRISLANGVYALTQDYVDWQFEGQGTGNVVVLDINGFDVSQTKFELLRLQGACNNSTDIRAFRCSATNFTGWNGIANELVILDNIGLIAGSTLLANSGSAAPEPLASVGLSLGGNAAIVQLRNWVGPLALTDITHVAATIAVDLNSGVVALDASNTAGTVTISGQGGVTDTSAGITLDISRLVRASAIAYAGAIHVDTKKGTPGAVEGINGTIDNPTNNLADARTLADLINSRVFNLRGEVTLDDSYDDWTFEGIGAESAVNLGGQDVQDSEFSGLRLSGDAADSTITVEKGVLDNVTRFRGFVRDSSVQGLNSLSAGTTLLMACVCNTPDTPPTFDLQGGSVALALSGYNGAFNLRNVDVNGTVVAEVVAGDIITLEPTCVGGTVTLAGIAELANQALGTDVNDASLISSLTENKRYSVLDSMVYDTNAKNMMVSARERVFPSEALATAARISPNGLGAEGAIETYAITAVAGPILGKPSSYAKIRVG